MDGREVLRGIKRADVTIEPIRRPQFALFLQIEKEYAGTPWSARAKEEIGRGYGIELHEDFDVPRGRGIKLPKL